MKNMIKKNQMMITALAIMIAVAGYLNFAGTKVTDEDLMTVNGEIATDDMGNLAMNQDDSEYAGLMDLSDEDIEQASGDIESLDSDVTMAVNGGVDEELAEALGVPTPPRALLETEDTAPPRDAAEPAKAPGEGRRTLAFAPTTSLDLRVCRKACFPPSRFISGLRTKSTAPAARASNTRTFREDTKIMGMGLVGRTSRRKSNPVIPGISMSRVIMSGFS